MAKFQKNNSKIKNKSHPRQNKFKPKSARRSKTPISNPNKRNFQKKHKVFPLKSKKEDERNVDLDQEQKEFEDINENVKKEKSFQKPNKIIQQKKDNEEDDIDDFKDDHYNENDFYFDENDYVDEGENLDFDEEDYVESDEDSQVGKDEKKPQKILTKKEFKKVYIHATRGKAYALTKLVRIFSKLVNPDLKFDFVENDNILNSHKFYKKMIKIAIKILPDMFNAKISSYKNKSDIPTSFKQLIRRFLAKYSYYITYTEKGLINFIFKYIHKVTDLVLLFKKLVPIFFKISLKVWAEAVGTRASENAFGFVVSIVEKNPLAFNDALKYTYFNYLNYAKAMNINSYSPILSLQRDIIGLLSSNYEQAYIIIFKFIRKLCVQLRATINDKKKSSIKNIYNWQFINSLSLWTNCTYSLNIGILEYYHRKETDIKLLTYPLVQVIIGTIRLNFVDNFFCLRLNLISLLNQISKKTGIFIPVANYLLEILESNVFTKKFNDYKETIIDVFLLLKLKKEDLKNYNIVKSLFEETLKKLTEFLAVNSNKLIFPEFSLLIISRLRKILKGLVDKNFKAAVKEMIEKITKHIDSVKAYRKQEVIDIKYTDSIKEHESIIFFKKEKLTENNLLIEEIEKNVIKEKEYMESRILQNKGDFIEI